VEPDPIGLNGGMNLFGYVEQNPTNRVDPLGLVSAPPIVMPMPTPIPLPPIAVPHPPNLTPGQLDDMRDFLGRFNPIPLAEYLKDKLIETTSEPYQPEQLNPCPQGDPEDLIRICIAGCRKKYSNNFFKRMICEIGCVVGTFQW
jgi:hypothetical protein